MTTVLLPSPGGGSARHVLADPVDWHRRADPPRRRRAYAAAHVVPRTLADNTPGAPADIDWDSTLAVRHHLWSHGLGVAEAMDTAQRGMGLDWAAASELVRRSAAEAASVGGLIAAGAGTDAGGEPITSLDGVVAAYEAQAAVVDDAGATVVLMASRDLARLARGPEDYATVYGKLLSQVRAPVVLHWLGEAFDPALRGYWGSMDLDEATRTLLAIIGEHATAVDGVKVSLLDEAREVALRRALPSGVRLYTGDDFHYPQLIRGDGAHASDALLGAFAAAAPAAAHALHALDAGDLTTYDAAMAATLPLSRHLFEAPTYHYKAGIAFLAWLSGRQPGFSMVGGMHAGRSVPHLVQAFLHADAAGLLPDPDLAAARLTAYLQVTGACP